MTARKGSARGRSVGSGPSGHPVGSGRLLDHCRVMADFLTITTSPDMHRDEQLHPVVA
jgi:hypothetical protein